MHFYFIASKNSITVLFFSCCTFIKIEVESNYYLVKNQLLIVLVAVYIFLKLINLAMFHLILFFEFFNNIIQGKLNQDCIQNFKKIKKN